MKLQATWRASGVQAAILIIGTKLGEFARKLDHHVVCVARQSTGGPVVRPKVQNELYDLPHCLSKTESFR